jgi:hypothetical protein
MSQFAKIFSNIRPVTFLARLVLTVSLLIPTAGIAASKAQIFQTLLVSQRASGITLSGGRAQFCVAGGSPGTVVAPTNLKAVYADRNKTTPAANPIQLSADGNVEVYGDGLYDVYIYNSAGVLKYSWEDVYISQDDPVIELTPEIFGAVGDGVADDTVPIQDALDEAQRTGDSVKMNSSQYKTTDTLHIWTGVNIISDRRSKILRYGFPTWDGGSSVIGPYHMMIAYGDNTIRGITFDGRASSITVGVPRESVNPPGPVWMSSLQADMQPLTVTPDGQTPDGPPYDDYSSPGNRKILVDDCNFIDSPGSHIIGASKGVVVTNSRFGNYYDHCFYMAGQGTTGETDERPAQDTIFSNNIVSVPSDIHVMSSSCIKFRNNAHRAVISGNTFNIPEDNLFTVDVGDAVNSEILFTGNSGVAKALLTAVSTFDGNTSVLDFSNNNIKLTADDYVILIGDFVNNYNFGDVNIRNNTLTIEDAGAYMLINGSDDGANNFTLDTNTIYGTFYIQPAGTINRLVVIKNTFIADASSPFLFSYQPAALPLDAGSALWLIKDNTFVNYSFINYEGGLTAADSVLAAANIIVDNNVMVNGSYAWFTPNDYSAYAGANTFVCKRNSKPESVTYPANRTFTDVSTIPVLTVDKLFINNLPQGLPLVIADGTFTYGPELVLNGDFALGSTNWILTNWVVSGGNASASTPPVANSATQVVVFELGAMYEITFDAVVTEGSVEWRLGSIPDVTYGINRKATGTYTERIIFHATDGGNIYFTGDQFFVGSIDNISIRKVLTGGEAGQVGVGEAIPYANIPTSDEKAAMTGAATPSGANPFATVGDLTP